MSNVIQLEHAQDITPFLLDSFCDQSDHFRQTRGIDVGELLREVLALEEELIRFVHVGHIQSLEVLAGMRPRKVSIFRK